MGTKPKIKLMQMERIQKIQEWYIMHNKNHCKVAWLRADNYNGFCYFKLDVNCNIAKLYYCITLNYSLYCINKT